LALILNIAPYVLLMFVSILVNGIIPALMG
jgi:hypothetical protein